MTGVELEIKPDLDEEAVQPDSDQQVPDLQKERPMVVTSAEVYTMCVSQIAHSKQCMNISTSVWSNLSHCVICEISGTARA